MAEYTETYKIIFELSPEGGGVPTINLGGANIAGAGASTAQNAGLAGLAGGILQQLGSTTIVNRNLINVIRRSTNKITYINKVTDATNGALQSSINLNKNLKGAVELMKNQRNSYRDRLRTVGESLGLGKGVMFEGNIYDKLNPVKFKLRVQQKLAEAAYQDKLLVSKDQIGYSYEDITKYTSFGRDSTSGTSTMQLVKTAEYSRK